MKKKHKAHEEEHADETWLIPYSDLLTLLLALFIVLFASSSVDNEKFKQMMAAFNTVLDGGNGILEQSSAIPLSNEAAMKSNKDGDDKSVSENKEHTKEELEKLAQAKKEQEDFEKLKRQIDEYIKENGLTSQLQTTLNSEQLVLKISDNALFPSGTATVKQEAKKLAASIANLLEQYPGYEVVVSGHTDNRPISTAEFESNWDLSTKRALNFMKILLQNKNVEPSRFSAIGYGEFRPVQSNDTDEGRSANRRVEVSIIRSIKDNPEQLNISTP